MLEDDFFCNMRRAVEHYVLDGLPVHLLELLDEVDGVIGCLDLPGSLNEECRWTESILKIKTLIIPNLKY